MQFKDYYETLGVSPDSSPDLIKSAYRKLARKFHPDVSKEKNAEERFKAVNEAYDVLKDQAKRREYDALRARGYRAGDEFQPPPDFGEGGFEFSGQEGFGDFFEALFNRGRGGTGAGAGPRAQARPREVRARFEIDLERAYAGGPERVSIGERTIEVKIPQGLKDGQTIRLARQAPGGGDLLLEIGYRPHRLYKVDGRDLTVHVPIAPWEAALGATVSVPTPGGTVDLKVPAGSSSGKRMRLKGRGLPGSPPGDQYVVLDVSVPPAESPAQRGLYEQLAGAYPGFDPRAGFS